MSTNTICIGCHGGHKEDRLSVHMTLVLVVMEVTRRTGCEHKYYWYWLSGRSQGGQVVSTYNIGAGCQGSHKEDKLSVHITLVLVVREVTRRTGCEHKYYLYWLSWRSQKVQIVSTCNFGINCQQYQNEYTFHELEY